jgi:hypothetical protein
MADCVTARKHLEFLFAAGCALWLVASACAQPAGGGLLHGGIDGQYFANPNLQGAPAFQRRDVRLDFDWGHLRGPGGSTSPGFASVGPGVFSARWSGQLVPRFTEDYRFSVRADRGVRVALKPASASADA